MPAGLVGCGHEMDITQPLVLQTDETLIVGIRRKSVTNRTVRHVAQACRTLVVPGPGITADRTDNGGYTDTKRAVGFEIPLVEFLET